MLILEGDFCLLAEIDADTIPEDCFAVEDLADGDGVFDGGEGDDDAAEGFEGGEGVDLGVGVDGGADALETGGLEDFGSVEVCYEEGVAGRRGLRELGQIREVEGETWRVASLSEG